MKILLDARSINRTGIGSYTRMLIYGLLSKGIDFKVMGSQKEIRNFYPNLDIVHTSSSIYSLREQISTLLAELKASDVSIVHYTNYNKSFFSKLPYIVTIHDLIQFKFGYGNPLKRKIAKIMLENSIVRAKGIICVSNSTKEDLVNMFPYIDSKKIYVVYNPAYNPTLKLDSSIDVKTKYGIPSYLLCVGNRKPHKNLELAVKSFNILAGEFNDLFLVIIAKKFESRDKLDIEIENSDYKSRILVLENVNYDELVSFYKFAELTILPSLYEGFGLIPFESISFGTLAMVSDIPIMRELFFEEDEIFFDPTNPRDLAQRVKLVLLNSEKKNMLINRLRKYLEVYSFEKFIAKTIEVYQECLL
ncbi:MAG: glycosyltransferase family 4 protein [Brevinematia bacterium]